MQSTRELFGDFFCKEYGVDPDAACEIEFVDAEELLVPRRLDVIGKILYLEALQSGRNRQYAEHIYASGIAAMTSGSFVEGGQEDSKNSLEKYEQSFAALEKSVREAGFDAQHPVPVGEDNAILDGAHRLAVCYVHGQKVPIVRFAGIRVCNDAEFLKKSYMTPEDVEYLVTEYCKRKADVHVICIWPKAKDEELRARADALIRENCSVVYQKDITFTRNGLRNLIQQIYWTQDWMGDAQSHFAGAMVKADECWEAEGKARFYVVECDSTEALTALKGEMREWFCVDKASIHSTDTWKECMDLVHLILNANSLHLMNLGMPDKYVELIRLLEEYKLGILETGDDLEDYLVDSSTVMGLYGIRETGDLDYLCGKTSHASFSNKLIEQNTRNVECHSQSPDALIYNPNNHLYYNQVKVITLPVLIDYKSNMKRDNENDRKKDQADIRLIESFLRQSFSLSDWWFRRMYELRKVYMRMDNRVHDIVRRYPAFHEVLRRIKYGIHGKKPPVIK